MITVRITDDGNIWPATSAEAHAANHKGFESRWDWKTFERAEEIAAGLTKTMGKLYIATDGGDGVYPRYDVIAVPELGDDVSYGFNGDSYPCGKIISISKTLRVITTSDGKRFYRWRQTGSWLNGGWSLIKGIHNERNPHF